MTILDTISGQTVVTTAGTAVVLGTPNINSTLSVKALPTNRGRMWVGNDGNNDVSSATGYVLCSGESVQFTNVGDMEEIYVDAEISNDGVSWLVLSI